MALKQVVPGDLTQKMRIEIKLPDLAEGIESADVLEVLVREGDEVVKDQGVVEIETDKATAEVPSTAAGRVTKIHVSPGQTIAAGTTLITLEAIESGAKPTAKTKKAKPSAAPQVPPTPSSGPSKPSRAPEPSSATAAAGPPPAAPPPPPSPPQPVRRRSPSTAVAAGPALRRFAREVGVDLTLVSGTGPGGRITREDILNVVRQASKAAQVGSAPVPGERPAPALPGTPSEDAWGSVSLEPLSKIRKTIAAKMHESWSTVPRVTNFDDADVTELEHIRQASKSDYAAAGIRLTLMPFLIKDVAMALKHHPLLNASLDPENEQIVYKQYINIGVAVDTPRGLVVPVLRGADALSIADTAKKLAVLADKVRNNDFTLGDLRGASFTISNLGAIGGTYSTPIVNVPEVAVLLVGRSRKMPVVVGDELVARLMMPLSLSYDHRLVDGATAARFLNDVIGYLEAPGRLLMAP
jgi:pyruvate dehydrogenase complex dihydrolipoamide acetyltransferase long form